ncbi:hypothetical protein AB6O49_28190 [Streptomyces sp. SBR177]
MRSAQDATAGAARPAASSRAAKTTQAGQPSFTMSRVASAGVTMEPSWVDMPNMPWYWPWAWSGARPKASDQEPAL